MFSNPVVNVALGLLVTFLVLSIFVGIIVQSLTVLMRWRGRTLLNHIKNLLQDRHFNGLARELYNHPLICPFSGGTLASEADLHTLPSFIDPKAFANAIADIIGISSESPDRCLAVIDERVSEPHLRRLFSGMVVRSYGDLPAMRQEIATWFQRSCLAPAKESLDHHILLWSFVISLIIAILFNVSAIGLARFLLNQPATQQAAPKPGDMVPLPMGWSLAMLKGLSSMTAVELILGWIITALAGMVGAPFWFDVLGKLKSIPFGRGEGGEHEG